MQRVIMYHQIFVVQSWRIPLWLQETPKFLFQGKAFPCALEAGKKTEEESLLRYMNSFPKSGYTQRGREKPPYPVVGTKFLDVRVCALCFTIYISVIPNKDPSRVLDLLWYLVHMIKASLEFEGPA